MEKDKKPSAFTAKDALTIGLTLIAITISILSFYYSNVRVEDCLQARIVDSDIIYGDSASEDTAVIEVAFMNIGNRQAIVLRPWCQLADTNNTYNGAWGAEFDNSRDFPFVLQPRELRLAKLKLSLSSINLNLGKIEFTSKGDTIYHSFCAIQYYALDSKAVTHDIFSNFETQIYTRKNGINGIMSTKELGLISSFYEPVVIFPQEPSQKGTEKVIRLTESN